MNIEKTEEAHLNELMREYRQIVYDLEIETHNVNDEIDKWTEIRNVLTKPYQDKLEELELKMRLPMLDRKTSFVCAYGKINYRKGAIRRTYNAEALDQLCAAKPELKDIIWPFRTESIGEPSITLKITGA